MITAASQAPSANGRLGRPRSELARRAVLEAVDDMLVDIGYAAMTMKGIAERAGVGRQTVYRWWSTKAEILLEACVQDAHEELQTKARPAPATDLLAYLKELNEFLTAAPAGLAYRALIGEAQHDPVVRNLINAADLLTISAQPVLDRARRSLPGVPGSTLATAQFIGPVVSQILTTAKPLSARSLREHVAHLVYAWDQD